MTSPARIAKYSSWLLDFDVSSFDESGAMAAVVDRFIANLRYGYIVINQGGGLSV
jgi:hypothetical protein